LGRSATSSVRKRRRKRQAASPSAVCLFRLADVPPKPLVACFLCEPLGVLTRQEALNVEVVGDHVPSISALSFA
jgi:hypothetical protein